MVLDPELNQPNVTSNFQLDPAGFVIGNLADFVEQGFETNKAILLSDPNHLTSAGLFSEIGRPDTMKKLAEKKTTITLEQPEDYQPLLDAYRKSGDKADLKGKIPEQFIPTLDGARRDNVEVKAIDLKTTERPASDREAAAEKEFRLHERIDAAASPQEKQAISDEFESKYSAEIKAKKEERTGPSNQRMAENIGKIIQAGGTVLHYNGESHTNNEIIPGLETNSRSDLDEMVGKYGPTLNVATLFNSKDIVTSVQKVDKANPGVAQSPGGRDLPEFVLSFPSETASALLQRETFKNSTHEQKEAGVDILTRGTEQYTGMLRNIAADFLSPQSSDTPALEAQKAKGLEALSSSVSMLSRADFDGAKKAFQDARAAKTFDGLKSAQGNNVDLNSLSTSLENVIDQIKEKTEAQAESKKSAMISPVKNVEEDHKITAPKISGPVSSQQNMLT